jgi:putative peptidoglycan lipid II flippase
VSAGDGRLATRVGAGILITRILGFVRERVFAHYFGDGPAADAFRAALRIPNIIRNLLGEGTLSASFIPVYAQLIAQNDEDGARKLAGSIVSLLMLLTAVAAFVGIALAPAITSFAAPGFTGTTRELTISLVEIMFPMSGVLILSAWCLGVLNTHRRFFLPYVAPAVWNVAQIAVLVVLGSTLLELRLVVALAWGALVGSVLQVLLQLPSTLRCVGRLQIGMGTRDPAVQRVVRAWIPVVVGAGVYQISSLVDQQLASLLEPGAVAILGYAQLVAILPVSLFGVSVAAVALPELSRSAAGTDMEALRQRLAVGTRRVAFFVLPSAVAFAALGSEILAALFQTGAFGAEQTAIAAGVLGAYAIGVPAQACVKLFASGHYAFGDTRTPVKIAVLSVIVSAGSAYVLMQRFGPAGIALGAAGGAYLNAGLNFWRLRTRLGDVLSSAGRRWILVSTMATIPAGAVGVMVAGVTPGGLLVVATAGVLAFGCTYGLVSVLTGHPEARQVFDRLRRVSGRGPGA